MVSCALVCGYVETVGGSRCLCIKSQSTWTLMHLACIKGRLAVVKFLLSTQFGTFLANKTS